MPAFKSPAGALQHLFDSMALENKHALDHLHCLPHLSLCLGKTIASFFKEKKTAHGN